MDLKRIIAGKQAKAHGQYFEKILSASAQQKGYESIKFHDGCIQRSKTKIQRIRTPFDFIFIKSPERTIYLDAKTTALNSFSYSQLTEHQVDKLHKLHLKGVHAGYLIYFRTVNQIVWFNAETLKNLKPRESLRPQDGIYTGSQLSIDLDIITNKLGVA